MLREGNSDRRAPFAVKEYARANPHRMGAWEAGNRAHVASMPSGDFFGNEQSVTIPKATTVRIEHVGTDGSTTVLKDGLALLAGEVVDGTFLSVAALQDFLRKQLADVRESGLLFSLHMKATMMKVSDPIIFGHVVRALLRGGFREACGHLGSIGCGRKQRFWRCDRQNAELPEAERQVIEADIQSALETGPGLAMVDSDKGITNLHVPSDVIIDASMPVVVRDSGCMWNAEGKLQETKAVIPDRCYSGVTPRHRLLQRAWRFRSENHGQHS